MSVRSARTLAPEFNAESTDKGRSQKNTFPMLGHDGQKQ